jgi:hypothetical protein
MNEREELLAAVGLAEAIIALRGSAVGRHLYDRAEAERQDALEALAYTSPEDVIAIRGAQSVVLVVDTIMRWLDEAEQAGDNAESLLRDQDE